VLCLERSVIYSSPEVRLRLPAVDRLGQYHRRPFLVGLGIGCRELIGAKTQSTEYATA
jgi:hypothetical protein